MNRDTKSFILGIGGSLAAAALIWLGTYLAGLVPPENGLYYTIEIARVGALTTWKLEFVNDSETAIDEFRLQPPVHQLIRSAFEPASTQKTDGETTSGWSGQLLCGQKLEALFVFDSDEIAFSQKQFRTLLTARSRTRDEEGRLTTTNVSIRFGSPPTISRLFKQIGMFLIPIAVAGLLVLGIIYAPRRKPKGAPAPGQ